MSSMIKNKSEIQKKWKQMEKEGTLTEKNGTLTFSSTPNEKGQCQVDIKENLEGLK